MAIEKDVLDELLAGRDPKDVFSKDGLVDELKKALSERILNAELDEHLDGEGGEGKGNHRNGYSKKSVLTGTSTYPVGATRSGRDLRSEADCQIPAPVYTENLNPDVVDWTKEPAIAVREPGPGPEPCAAKRSTDVGVPHSLLQAGSST